MFFFYRPLNAACKHLGGFTSGFVHAGWQLNSMDTVFCEARKHPYWLLGMGELQGTEAGF